MISSFYELLGAMNGYSNSYNSDGQWPPTLPEAPHIIHPFNYQYCFENLLRAEQLVGGVDRGRLSTDPLRTLHEILSIQQEMILRRAQKMLDSKDRAEVAVGRQAEALIHASREVGNMSSDEKVLYPSEYASRAEALVEARRLVGGIEIERIDPPAALTHPGSREIPAPKMHGLASTPN